MADQGTLSWASSSFTLNTGIGTTVVAHGNGVTVVLPKGSVGDYAYRSVNGGLTWTQHALPVAARRFDVLVWNGTRFMALQRLGDDVITSVDGATWVSATTTGPTAMTGLAYGNSIWLAVSSDAVHTSADNGASWVFQGDHFGGIGISTHIAFGAGVFCVGDETGAVQRTADGVSWSTVMVSSGNAITNITWIGNAFIAASSNGNVYKSLDGIAWSLLSDNDAFAQIVGDSGFYFANRSSTYTVHSADSLGWVTTARTFSAEEYAWTGSVVVVVHSGSQHIGTFIPPPPPNNGAEIVFLPLTSSPETLGAQSANLPSLQSIGTDVANAGTGAIALESSGTLTKVTHAIGTGLADLPGLRSFGTQQAGNWGAAELPALTSAGFYAATPVPSDGVGDAELPRLESFGVGVFHNIGTGLGYLPALDAYGLDVAGNYGEADLPALYSVGASVAPVYTTYIYGVLPPFVAAVTATNDLHLYAGFAAADNALLQHMIPVVDGFVPAAQGTSLAKQIIALQDEVTLQALASIVYQFVEVEAFVADASAVSVRRQIAVAVEMFTALAVAENKAKTIDAVVAAITLEALALRGWQFEEVASAVFVAEARETLRRIEALVEAIVLEDIALPHARFTMVLAEGVEFADVAASNARFFELLTESVLVTARLTLRGEAYVAWAINAESGAPSRYSGFGFNSFAAYEINGVTRYFGAMDDGIHELVGDTDAGEPIAAKVRGALSNYGSSALKGMPMVYVALATSGEIVMKFYVTDPDTGQREAHWYKLEGRAAPALREDRLQPDRGLESVYWNWELVNVNGADFEIDGLGFVPLYLSKRV